MRRRDLRMGSLMTDDCCPSDFSRQRAVVMTNPLLVVLDAIDAAIDDLPPEPPVQRVESLLVQMEQVTHRLAPGQGTDQLRCRLQSARAALVGADYALALAELKDTARSTRAVLLAGPAESSGAS